MSMYTNNYYNISKQPLIKQLQLMSLKSQRFYSPLAYCLKQECGHFEDLLK
jgi:hypothetical protein